MPRPRQQEADRAGEMLGQLPHAFQRGDMIFPPCLHIGGRPDPAQVDGRARDADRARLHQQVVAIELRQIILVSARWPVGGVAVTVEQVEGRVILRSEAHTSELQSLMRISYAVFCLPKKHIDTYTLTS